MRGRERRADPGPDEGDAVAARRPRRPEDGACALCAAVTALTFHHLIPRRQHAKPWFRREFGLDEMRRRGVWLCRGCHGFIHEHFDENRLGRTLNTLERLREEPLIARHVAWASRQRRRAPGAAD